MKFIKKYFSLVIFSSLFLMACTQNSTEKEQNLPENISPNQIQINTPIEKLGEESVDNSNTTLPKLPTGLSEGVTNDPQPVDIQNLPEITLQDPDPVIVEAMDPNSKKDCDSYEAETLKQICYSARGLSSNPEMTTNEQ